MTGLAGSPVTKGQVPLGPLQGKQNLQAKEVYLIFFNFIQNSHVHEPSKLIENLHHLPITTEQNLNSNPRLKKPRIQCFEIHCLNVLLTQNRSATSVCCLRFQAHCRPIIYQTCSHNVPRATKHGSDHTSFLTEATLIEIRV